MQRNVLKYNGLYLLDEHGWSKRVNLERKYNSHLKISVSDHLFKMAYYPETWNLSKQLTWHQYRAFLLYIIRPTTAQYFYYICNSFITLQFKTCKNSYVGQTGRSLTVRHREHIRYIKTNNSLPAYAMDILNNQHEDGNSEGANHM